MAEEVDVETVHFDLQAVIRPGIPVLECGVKASFAQCADQMFGIRICLIFSISLFGSYHGILIHKSPGQSNIHLINLDTNYVPLTQDFSYVSKGIGHSITI